MLRSYRTTWFEGADPDRDDHQPVHPRPAAFWRRRARCRSTVAHADTSQGGTSARSGIRHRIDLTSGRRLHEPIPSAITATRSTSLIVWPAGPACPASWPPSFFDDEGDPLHQNDDQYRFCCCVEAVPVLRPRPPNGRHGTNCSSRTRNMRRRDREDPYPADSRWFAQPCGSVPGPRNSLPPTANQIP